MDKKVVRASYESCLDATARLSAYATSQPFKGANEVNNRQDILATDDLIVFCIHARRLVENVGLNKFVKQSQMQTSDGTSMSLWKIIGCLIHHDMLEVIRCGSRFKMLQISLEGLSREEFFRRAEKEMRKPPYSEPIPPHVLFKSDKIHYTLINLVEFQQMFSQEILPEVVRKSLDKGFCLIDDPFKDLDMSEEALSALNRMRSKA